MVSRRRGRPLNDFEEDDQTQEGPGRDKPESAHPKAGQMPDDIPSQAGRATRKSKAAALEKKLWFLDKPGYKGDAASKASASSQKVRKKAKPAHTHDEDEPMEPPDFAADRYCAPEMGLGSQDEDEPAVSEVSPKKTAKRQQPQSQSPGLPEVQRSSEGRSSRQVATKKSECTDDEAVDHDTAQPRRGRRMLSKGKAKAHRVVTPSVASQDGEDEQESSAASVGESESEKEKAEEDEEGEQSESSDDGLLAKDTRSLKKTFEIETPVWTDDRPEDDVYEEEDNSRAHRRSSSQSVHGRSTPDSDMHHSNNRRPPPSSSSPPSTSPDAEDDRDLGKVAQLKKARNKRPPSPCSDSDSETSDDSLPGTLEGIITHPKKKFKSSTPPLDAASHRNIKKSKFSPIPTGPKHRDTATPRTSSKETNTKGGYKKDSHHKLPDKDRDTRRKPTTASKKDTPIAASKNKTNDSAKKHARDIEETTYIPPDARKRDKREPGNSGVSRGKKRHREEEVLPYVYVLMLNHKTYPFSSQIAKINESDTDSEDAKAHAHNSKRKRSKSTAGKKSLTDVKDDGDDEDDDGQVSGLEDERIDLVYNNGLGKLGKLKQHPRVRRTLGMAIAECQMNILTKTAFPEGTGKYNVVARYALTQAAERLGYTQLVKRLKTDDEYAMALASIPVNRIPLFRSKAKDVVKATVKTVYNLKAGDEPHVNWLQHGCRYIYPHQYEDKFDGENAYRLSIFADGIQAAYFSSPKSFGWKITKRFTSSLPDKPDELEIPAPLLALISTAVFAVIEEHRSARCEAIDFTTNAFSKAYERNMKILNSIRAEDPDEYHNLTHGLYEAICGGGTNHLRAQDDEDDDLKFLKIKAKRHD
ncbi:hypothetical protein BN946_scf184970.g70 [Trametes cinnabarina]|uniref:DUF6532 domain-containing protein n=1 Tax=Pycnoporus cinnabarinus TaxID=5643 RepID=A0A060SIG5_PYCCI|nr:hypothetical protein BN946_scf184970.g70 [Trametes cinnabarina]